MTFPKGLRHIHKNPGLNKVSLGMTSTYRDYPPESLYNTGFFYYTEDFYSGKYRASLETTGSYRFRLPPHVQGPLAHISTGPRPGLQAVYRL